MTFGSLESNGTIYMTMASRPQHLIQLTHKGYIMKPTEVISHIVCSLTLVTSIVVGFNGMNEYGVAPLWALLTLGGSFLLGFQLMLIITGE